MAGKKDKSGQLSTISLKGHDHQSTKFNVKFIKVSTLFLIIQWLLLGILYLLLVTCYYLKPWNVLMTRISKVEVQINGLIVDLESIRNIEANNNNNKPPPDQIVQTNLGHYRNAMIDYFEDNMLKMFNATDEDMKFGLKSLEAKLIDLLFPIGSIYVQFPFQQSPEQLWSNQSARSGGGCYWTEVTHLYAGHFFRAEGGNSFPFGVSQSDALSSHHHPFLYEIHHPSYFRGNNVWSKRTNYLAFKEGKTLNVIGEPIVNETTNNGRETVKVASETRPLNYAIRIWQRI